MQVAIVTESMGDSKSTSARVSFSLSRPSAGKVDHTIVQESPAARGGRSSLGIKRLCEPGCHPSTHGIGRARPSPTPEHQFDGQPDERLLVAVLRFHARQDVRLEPTLTTLAVKRRQS